MTTQEEITTMLTAAESLPEPIPTAAQQHQRQFHLEYETICLWWHDQASFLALQEANGSAVDFAALEQEAAERIDTARVRLWERLRNLLKQHSPA